MNIKIAYHIMPWEIDYALLSFTQLKKSKYHLPSDVVVEIDTVLNLSDYLIDWSKSKLPKQFFIDKYDQISNLLIDYTHNKKVYEGDELYGHLDLQRDAIAEHVDGYLGICPDMYFGETTLSYLIQAAQQIPQEYFVITPQTYKLWDASWDDIVNPIYLDQPYDSWPHIDIYDVIHNDTYTTDTVAVKPIPHSKYAGWFDLYSKSFYEKLAPIPQDWKGYGSWDSYSSRVADIFKQQGGDYSQYVLEGKTVFEYPLGPLEKGFGFYYKDYLSLKDITDQRDTFKDKLQEYIMNRISNLSDILK
jgi:hypothetical protein